MKYHLKLIQEWSSLRTNIDDKLIFSEHIKDISKRASQKVGVLPMSAKSHTLLC